jgi:hypothetical protein
MRRTTEGMLTAKSPARTTILVLSIGDNTEGPKIDPIIKVK